MKLEIITPKEKLFEGEITLISLPGTLGAFEILKNHAPIISTLTAGDIKIIDIEKNSHLFKVKSGLVEASNNNISVLVET